MSLIKFKKQNKQINKKINSNISNKYFFIKQWVHILELLQFLFSVCWDFQPMLYTSPLVPPQVLILLRLVILLFLFLAVQAIYKDHILG